MKRILLPFVAIIGCLTAVVFAILWWTNKDQADTAATVPKKTPTKTENNHITKLSNSSFFGKTIGSTKTYTSADDNKITAKLVKISLTEKYVVFGWKYTDTRGNVNYEEYLMLDGCLYVVHAGIPESIDYCEERVNLLEHEPREWKTYCPLQTRNYIIYTSSSDTIDTDQGKMSTIRVVGDSLDTNGNGLRYSYWYNEHHGLVQFTREGRKYTLSSSPILKDDTK